jgi:hypothetical protein
MAKFVIVHGSFKHPSHVTADGKPLDHPHAAFVDNGFLGVSPDPSKPHVLDVSEKEAEKLDPGCTKTKLDKDGKEIGPWGGFCLKPLALHEAELKGAAASKAELDKAKAPVVPKPGGSK